MSDAEGLVERVAEVVRRRIQTGSDNTARHTLREVADALEEQAHRGIPELSGQRRICFRAAAEWVREQAAEEGA